MELINNLKYKYANLDVLGQIIVWMVICFVLPFLFNTIIFLFNINSFSLISFFEVSPSFYELIYKPWSLITYGFFHADLWHLVGVLLAT